MKATQATASGLESRFYPNVSRVAIVAPWEFEVIRRSVKKTDKNDARSIAFFLSKDIDT